MTKKPGVRNWIGEPPRDDRPPELKGAICLGEYPSEEERESWKGEGYEIVKAAGVYYAKERVQNVITLIDSKVKSNSDFVERVRKFVEEDESGLYKL